MQKSFFHTLLESEFVVLWLMVFEYYLQKKNDIYCSIEKLIKIFHHSMFSMFVFEYKFLFNDKKHRCFTDLHFSRPLHQNTGFSGANLCVYVLCMSVCVNAGVVVFIICMCNFSSSQKLNLRFCWILVKTLRKGNSHFFFFN